MNKKLIITTLALLLIMPLNVHALSGTVKVTCEKNSISLGESTNCSITATTNEEVSSIHSIIDVSDGLELISVTRSDIWIGDHDKVLDLYTDSNKKDNFDIATFTIKGTKKGTQKINLLETLLGDLRFKEHQFTVESYTITVDSTTEGEESNSSSSKPSSSSSSSSSSSQPSSSQPSSSQPSSSQPSSSSSSKKETPEYKIELEDNKVYVSKKLKLTFFANTKGTVKITSKDKKKLTVSTTSYELGANSKKEFELTGVKAGETTVTVEFIPDDTTKYNSITKEYKITIKKIPNKDTNIDKNPPTGGLLVLIVSFVGLFILGYSYWSYKTSK